MPTGLNRKTIARKLIRLVLDMRDISGHLYEAGIPTTALQLLITADRVDEWAKEIVREGKDAS